MLKGTPIPAGADAERTAAYYEGYQVGTENPKDQRQDSDKRNHDEPPGKWCGSKSAEFGIDGAEVGKGELKNALVGRDPITEKDLARNAGAKHKPGWDLVASAPKSVSVLWAASDKVRQEAISRAQQNAVEKTIDYMESSGVFEERFGRAGSEPPKPCKEILAATFEHASSRAGDPQLHTHIVVSNMGTGGRGIDYKIQREKDIGAFYREKLEGELNKLGIQTEKDGEFFRVKDVPRELEKVFSKRSLDVDAGAKARGGVNNPALRAQAAKASRPKKTHAPRRDAFSVTRKVAKEFGFNPRSVFQKPSLQSPTIDKGHGTGTHIEQPRNIARKASVSGQTPKRTAQAEAKARAAGKKLQSQGPKDNGSEKQIKIPRSTNRPRSSSRVGDGGNDITHTGDVPLRFPVQASHHNALSPLSGTSVHDVSKLSPQLGKPLYDHKERENPLTEGLLKAFEGKLIDQGQAPYQFRSGNSRSHYAELQTAGGGKQIIWGAGLKEALQSAGAVSEKEKLARLDGKTHLDELSGIKGRLVDSGTAPYKFKVGAQESFYAKIEHRRGGVETVWGKGVRDALKSAGAAPGDTVLLRKEGVENINVKAPGGGEKTFAKNIWQASRVTPSHLSRELTDKPPGIAGDGVRIEKFNNPATYVKPKASQSGKQEIQNNRPVFETLRGASVGWEARTGQQYIHKELPKEQLQFSGKEHLKNMAWGASKGFNSEMSRGVHRISWAAQTEARKLGNEISQAAKSEFRRSTSQYAISKTLHGLARNPIKTIAYGSAKFATRAAWRIAFKPILNAATRAAGSMTKEAIRVAARTTASSVRGAVQGAARVHPRTQGRLIDHGVAPYQNRPGNAQTPFAKIYNGQGKVSTFWGKELEKALKDSGAQRGDMVRLQPNASENGKNVSWTIRTGDKALSKAGQLGTTSEGLKAIQAAVKAAAEKQAKVLPQITRTTAPELSQQVKERLQAAKTAVLRTVQLAKEPRNHGAAAEYRAQKEQTRPQQNGRDQNPGKDRLNSQRTETSTVPSNGTKSQGNGDLRADGRNNRGDKNTKPEQSDTQQQKGSPGAEKEPQQKPDGREAHPQTEKPVAEREHEASNGKTEQRDTPAAEKEPQRNPQAVKQEAGRERELPENKPDHQTEQGSSRERNNAPTAERGSERRPDGQGAGSQPENPSRENIKDTERERAGSSRPDTEKPEAGRQREAPDGKPDQSDTQQQKSSPGTEKEPQQKPDGREAHPQTEKPVAEREHEASNGKTDQSDTQQRKDTPAAEKIQARETNGQGSGPQAENPEAGRKRDTQQPKDSRSAEKEPERKPNGQEAAPQAEKPTADRQREEPNGKSELRDTPAPEKEPQRNPQTEKPETGRQRDDSNTDKKEVSQTAEQDQEKQPQQTGESAEQKNQLEQQADGHSQSLGELIDRIGAQSHGESMSRDELEAKIDDIGKEQEREDNNDQKESKSEKDEKNNGKDEGMSR